MAKEYVFYLYACSTDAIKLKNVIITVMHSLSKEEAGLARITVSGSSRFSLSTTGVATARFSFLHTVIGVIQSLNEN